MRFSLDAIILGVRLRHIQLAFRSVGLPRHKSYACDTEKITKCHYNPFFSPFAFNKVLNLLTGKMGLEDFELIMPLGSGKFANVYKVINLDTMRMLLGKEIRNLEEAHF